MPTICCIPGCNNSRDGHRLHHIPSKKFYSGEKKRWAEESEKVIRSIRQDKWLDSLYKRDGVMICEDHFDPSDLIQKGTRVHLRVGAIPTLNLPSKSVEVAPPAPRRSPKKRKLEDRIYHDTLNDLTKSAMRHLPQDWHFQSEPDHIILHTTTSLGSFPRLMVKIKDSLDIKAGYHGWFACSSDAIQSIDVRKTTLTQMLHMVSNFLVCSGIPESCRMNCPENNSVTQHCITSYDYASDVPETPKSELIAVRSRQCEVFLLTEHSCQPCKIAARHLNNLTLSKQTYRQTVQNQPLKHRVSNALASRQMATIKFQDQKLKEAEEKISSLLKHRERQIPLDCDLITDFTTIFSNGLEDNTISPFYKLFWREQAKLTAASKHGQRFHPELIKFCLRLAMKSTSAYEQLRDSGILVLPSTRTLFHYRSLHSSTPGFLESTEQELTKIATSMKEHERLVVLSMDEVKVKENIVYSNSLDKMVGFVDIGDSRTSSDDKIVPATHVLQVYVRGLLTPFSRPIAYYATKSINSHQLTSIFWECVGKLKDCSFKVVAFISDGLSANRKMFHDLNNLKLKYPYKCMNIFDPGNVIYLIFDPPHLLKTIRNCVYASRNAGTKSLKKDDKDIRWEHFTAVPNLFASHELRCSKLTDAHFRMHSYSKMRVIYAAQLLSQSVANLMYRKGGPEMEASAWFAQFFNKWFDLMNTTTRFKCNSNLKPYRNVDDERIVWLENEFLPQLRNWRSSCVGQTATDKAKQFLTWQTYEGLEITTAAIIELIRSLLPTLPDGSFIITRRLNQDPLEAFFGQIRRSGGTCENPDVERYGHLQRIIGFGKSLKHLKKSCKGSNVRFDAAD